MTNRKWSTVIKNKIGLALLGASRIASHVLPSIREVSAFEVIGVAASELTRAENFAQEHKIQKAFKTYAEALQDPSVDAVYISVLSADHYSLIKKALENGKHVLCEKPIVLTTDHTQEVTKLAAINKKVLLEGFMYRFHPHTELLKRAVKDRTLGELKSIHLSFGFILGTAGTKRGLRSGGGGALNDLGSYLIDFATVILGCEELPEIKAWGVVDRSDPEAIDQGFVATLCYSNKVTVTIDAAIDRPASNLWEIRGTKGSIGVLRFDPQGTSSTGSESVVIRIDESSHAQIVPFKSDQDPMGQFRREFQNFADAIAGHAAPFISLKEILLKSQILEKIQSQFTGHV